jgi:hypothetical protein
MISPLLGPSRKPLNALRGLRRKMAHFIPSAGVHWKGSSNSTTTAFCAPLKKKRRWAPGSLVVCARSQRHLRYEYHRHQSNRSTHHRRRQHRRLHPAAVGISPGIGCWYRKSGRQNGKVHAPAVEKRSARAMTHEQRRGIGSVNPSSVPRRQGAVPGWGLAEMRAR